MNETPNVIIPWEIVSFIFAWFDFNPFYHISKMKRKYRIIFRSASLLLLISPSPVQIAIFLHYSSLIRENLKAITRLPIEVA